jgi:uncharacterized protein (DUF58 family)
MRFPETIFAGEETPILVSLHNRKKLMGSYSVVAEVRGRERDESIAVRELAGKLPAFIVKRLAKPALVRKTLDYFKHVPRSSIQESKTTHTFDHRGRFVIRDFELSTRFPFGFFRHRRRLPAQETELTVFPKLLPLENDIDELPLDAGRLVANKRGSGQDLLALRDYRPNDDFRRVDWKATARSRHLIVREFAAEDDKRVTIYLDTRVPEAKRKMSIRAMLEAEQAGERVILSKRFERAVSLVASLLAHFTEEQAEVRLIIDGDKGEFGIGSRHLYENLKRLAVVDPFLEARVNGSGLAEWMRGEAGQSDNSHFFLITTLSPQTLPVELAENLKLLQY